MLTLIFPSTVDYDLGILCEEQYIRLYVHEDSGYSEHMTHWAYSGHHFDEIEYGKSEHIEYEVPHDGRYLINILLNAGHGSYELKVEVQNEWNIYLIIGIAILLITGIIFVIYQRKK